jgi:uncharacterized protein involved in exopolysaccharide biosynthesis
VPGGGSLHGGPLSRQESEIHLLDRLAVLYRYRRIALAVFLLTLAVLVTQRDSRVQVYQAQARLLIEDGAVRCAG